MVYRVARPSATVRWGIVALVLAVDLAGSLLVSGPPSAAVGVVPLAAWLHVAGYAALTAALAAALDEPGRPAWLVLAVAFGGAILVGAAVEAIQPAFGRRLQSRDVAANAVGAGTAVVAYALAHLRVRFE